MDTTLENTLEKEDSSFSLGTDIIRHNAVSFDNSKFYQATQNVRKDVEGNRVGMKVGGIVFSI